MCVFIESKYASTFSPKNLTQVISLFDSLNLSLDVYQFLVTYAHGKGINSINAMLAYIEKVAVSLCEKKITSLDEAEKYLSNYSNPNKKSKPTNKFINFEQQNWDFEEIKRMEEEFIDEDIKRINKDK